MKLRNFVTSVCVCVASLVAATMAQQVQQAQTNPQKGPLSMPKSTQDRVSSPDRTPQVSTWPGKDVNDLNMETESVKMIDQWKNAQSESDREKAQGQLREVVKGQFQVHLNKYEKEVEQLEAKVKQLREQLELRRKKQDEIVDFRVQQLLRETQGLGWGTESPVPGTQMGTRASTRKSGSDINIDRATEVNHW